MAKKCYGSKEVADQFNKLFTDVAAKLVGGLPQPSGLYDVDSERFKSYYRHVKPGSFVLHEVSEDFVYDELNNLNISKSTLQLLTTINPSIRSQVFPSAMKIAKVKPLFKKTSRLEVGKLQTCKHLTCGF